MSVVDGLGPEPGDLGIPVDAQIPAEEMLDEAERAAAAAAAAGRAPAAPGAPGAPAAPVAPAGPEAAGAPGAAVEPAAPVEIEAPEFLEEGGAGGTRSAGSGQAPALPGAAPAAAPAAAAAAAAGPAAAGAEVPVELHPRAAKAAELMLGERLESETAEEWGEKRDELGRELQGLAGEIALPISVAVYHHMRQQEGQQAQSGQVAARRGAEVVDHLQAQLYRVSPDLAAYQETDVEAETLQPLAEAVLARRGIRLSNADGTVNLEGYRQLAALKRADFLALATEVRGALEPLAKRLRAAGINGTKLAAATAAGMPNDTDIPALQGGARSAGSGQATATGVRRRTSEGFAEPPGQRPGTRRAGTEEVEDARAEEEMARFGG